MRILLDTFYLYRLIVASGQFAEAEHQFFEENEAQLEDQHVTFLLLTIAHAARALETPLAHKDPFDELLLVQAQEEGLKLLTVDRHLVGHPLTITI